MDIFHAARHYEFDRIKEYIMQGGEVNVCDECGLSLLTCFVQGYFEFGEACFLAEEIEEDGRLFGREEYKMLNTALEKRSSGIRAQLDWLLSCGADVNLCRMVNGQTETALMQAVIYCDAHMVRYLLEHGADPKVRLFEESGAVEYWLLEDLDCHMMNVRHDEEAEMLLEIARSLSEYGLQGWSGLCIDTNIHRMIE